MVDNSEIGAVNGLFSIFWEGITIWTSVDSEVGAPGEDETKVLKITSSGYEDILETCIANNILFTSVCGLWDEIINFCSCLLLYFHCLIC